MAKKQIVGYARGNAGIAPEKVLAPAALKASEVVVDEAIARGPGPHIVAEINRKGLKKGELMVEIGPDKAHFYYKFFETGVQPFEIDLVAGKSRRTSGKRRKVRKNAKVMKFGDQFAKRVHRGGMAARPWLRPALESKQDEAREAMGREFLNAILAIGVGG